MNEFNVAMAGALMLGVTPVLIVGLVLVYAIWVRVLESREVGELLKADEKAWKALVEHRERAGTRKGFLSGALLFAIGLGFAVALGTQFALRKSDVDVAIALAGISAFCLTLGGALMHVYGARQRELARGESKEAEENDKQDEPGQ